jgi:MOSC domain-containing protein YiiM
MNLQGVVIAVCSSPTHDFCKPPRKSINLLKGLGIEDDAHMGEKVQHLSRIRANPDQPNLRQVHLMHSELHEELKNNGLHILPGEMGENITTKGIDILNLPVGTKLYLGPQAILEVTGLRNPCQQLNKFRSGLMDACLERDEQGTIQERKGGIMSVVLEGGEVKPNDVIKVELPPQPHKKLAVV